MKPDIVEKIRRLLEEAQKIYLYYGVCDFTERVAEIKQLIHKALSLFPPVCGECGGSGCAICPNCTGSGIDDDRGTCKQCEGRGGVPCPCQAPAGEVEKLVEDLRFELAYRLTAKVNNKFDEKVQRACTHLTAQAKQIERYRVVLEATEKDFLERGKQIKEQRHTITDLDISFHNVQPKEWEGYHRLKQDIKSLQAKIQQLEGENRWIPVSERLPEKTDEDLRPQVLVYDGESVTGALWRHYSFGWDFETDRGEPTHWKPIILPDQALKGEAE